MLKAMFGVVVACLLGTPAALLRPQNGRKAPPKGLAAEVVAPVPPIGGRSLPWLFEQAIKVGRRRNAVLDVVAPPPLGGRSLPSLLGKRPEIPIVARADAIAADRPEALAAPRPPSVLGRLGAPGKNNVLAFPGAEALARRQRAKISAAALAALLLADPDDCLDEDLRLTRGAVPRELSGTLYVNGPARLKVGTVGSSAHPLDGHGYVRSFRIQRDAAHDFDDPHVRQRVRLKGRFVKTWAFEVETFFGFNVFRGFFSLPFLPLRELGFAFNALAMWRKNVANTCVVEWPPGQLLALWEMGPPHALDAETLRTTKSWSHLEYLATSDCALSRLRPLLAHTKTWTDGDASTLVGLSALGSSYTFYEFGLDGALASSTEATMPFESSIVHDFAITEDYYVVQENPVVYTGDVGAALGAAPMPATGPWSRTSRRRRASSSCPGRREPRTGRWSSTRATTRWPSTSPTPTRTTTGPSSSSRRPSTTTAWAPNTASTRSRARSRPRSCWSTTTRPGPSSSRRASTWPRASSAARAR